MRVLSCLLWSMNERAHTNALLSISVHVNSDTSPWSIRTEIRQQKQLSLSRYRRFKLGAQKKEKNPKLEKLVRMYIHVASRDGLLGTIYIPVPYNHKSTCWGSSPHYLDRNSHACSLLSQGKKNRRRSQKKKKAALVRFPGNVMSFCG